jgi:hypothetical protein
MTFKLDGLIASRDSKFKQGTRRLNSSILEESWKNYDDKSMNSGDACMKNADYITLTQRRKLKRWNNIYIASISILLASTQFYKISLKCLIT